MDPAEDGIDKNINEILYHLKRTVFHDNWTYSRAFSSQSYTLKQRPMDRERIQRQLPQQKGNQSLKVE